MTKFKILTKRQTLLVVGGLAISSTVTIIVPKWVAAHAIALTASTIAISMMGSIAASNLRRANIAIREARKVAARARLVRQVPMFGETVEDITQKASELTDTSWISLSVLAWLAKTLKEHQQLATQPPPTARFLLFFVPDRDRDAVFGDIDEKYWTRYLPEHGVRKARLLYRYQVALTIGAFLWDKIVRLVTLIVMYRGVK